MTGKVPSTAGRLGTNAQNNARPGSRKRGKPRIEQTIPRPSSRRAGSGVIVSADAFILTSDHVIAGADEILVGIGSEKREHKAKEIGAHTHLDSTRPTRSTPSYQMHKKSAPEFPPARLPFVSLYLTRIR